MAGKIKSGKIYKYFVSCAIQKKGSDNVINFGNYEVILNKKICSFENIKLIQKHLEHEKNIYIVVILNYKLLCVEYAK